MERYHGRVLSLAFICFDLKPVLLIYSDSDTPRLRYVLHWIFVEQLGITFGLTTDIASWNSFKGAKINYSAGEYANESLRIIPHNLLKETGIRTQQLFVNRWKRSTILFYNQPGAKIPFDIFAAVFYLVTRYEEYLPNEKDNHGRYKPEQSAAFRFSFLQQPVVDEWLFHFGKVLEQRFAVKLPEKQFHFKPTYDIDIAWKYRHKGFRRHWGGLLKDLVSLKWGNVRERLAVTAGKENDPFDCFGWLDQLHKQYNLHPVYFMLLAQNTNAFDKNADPGSGAMRELTASLAQQYEMGIHPSYASHEDAAVLKQEMEILEETSQRKITKSRQHYIRFTLPETYEELIRQGIREDYSMGYASCNGFRAGTSNSFLWYDLQKENVTSLRVHPFAFMEATSKFYLKQKPREAWMEWERLWHAVRKTNGTFISIWHNYMLGTDKAGKGWRELYLRALEQL